MQFVKPCHFVAITTKKRWIVRTHALFAIHLYQENGTPKWCAKFFRGSFAVYVQPICLKYTTSSPSFNGKTRFGFWAIISSGIA